MATYTYQTTSWYSKTSEGQYDEPLQNELFGFRQACVQMAKGEYTTKSGDPIELSFIVCATDFTMESARTEISSIHREAPRKAQYR